MRLSPRTHQVDFQAPARSGWSALETVARGTSETGV